MIITLKQHAPQEEVERLVQSIEEKGLKTSFLSLIHI